MDMQTYGNTGISMRVYSEIRTIARDCNVDKVLLFGSRARGDYKEKSDIDLAFSGGDAVRFILDIDEKTYTLLMFDIIDLNKPLDSAICESIQREGIVLYEKG